MTAAAPGPTGPPPPVDGDDVDRFVVPLLRLGTELVWRIDHGHASSAYELFSSDGALIVDPRSWRGTAELRVWGAERDASGRHTRHSCTNHRYLPAGPGRATGTVLVTAFVEDPSAPGTIGDLIVGEYADDYVVEDGTWRIASRRFERLFTHQPTPPAARPE